MPARPAPADQALGASVNLLFNTVGVPAALIARQLSGLAAAGASLARSDALWEATEPQPPHDGVHHYDWAFDDRVAGDLAAHRLRWLPVLDYSAPWTQSITGQDHSPPRSVADYAAYAQAFAARYGNGGTFWHSHPSLSAEPVTAFEIWNEPDNGEFWTPRPDPAGYADLYLAARSAIDAVDPTARVLIGGLTQATTFVPAMLAERPALIGHIDGVAVHPYGPPTVVLARLEAARSMLRSVGLSSVPLYATEFGWTTLPPRALDYVEAAMRPAYIFTTLTELGQHQCGLAAAILYTWYSPELDPADSQQWYGVSGVTGTPTPDTTAFAAGVRRATSRATPPRPCG